MAPVIRQHQREGTNILQKKWKSTVACSESLLYAIAPIRCTAFGLKYLLDRQNVPNKIWLLHDKTRSRFHTILTFEAENKTVYLELTPQSSKPCYGKEIIFDNEQEFIAQYIQNNFDITDVTDSIIVGDAPDFVLSRMA